jgi:hypothetical protein
VANVMVDGPMTIPPMKRSGFKPAFAAGVEATASKPGWISDLAGFGLLTAVLAIQLLLDQRQGKPAEKTESA